MSQPRTTDPRTIEEILEGHAWEDRRRTAVRQQQEAQVLEFGRRVPVATVQGTLALDLYPREEVPEPSAVPSRPACDVVAIDAARRRHFEQFARRVGAVVVEIVGGDRPVTQLRRWTTASVYQDLARRAWLVAQSAGTQPGQGRVQPVRPHVVGSHVCFVDRRVAEVSLHVRYGARSRAVAARFELRRDRWQITALEFA